MEYLAGISLAIAIAAFAKRFDLEKEKFFYPLILVAIALIYLVFGAFDGRAAVFTIEAIYACLFILAAMAAAWKWPLIAGVAILLHGLFDLAHHLLLENTGVPDWYPGFCAAVDIPLGAFIIFFHLKGKKSPGN